MPAKPRAAIDPKLRGKILRFFLENEGSIDTPRGVSTWIEENLPAVRKALEHLADKGVLKAHRTTSTVGYSCPLPKKKIAEILSRLKKV